MCLIASVGACQCGLDDGEGKGGWTSKSRVGLVFVEGVWVDGG